MKKSLVFLLTILFTVLFPFFSLAQTQELEIHFFYGSVCPHCVAEKEFLNEIEKKYPEIEVNRYLVSSPQNQELLKELCKECGAEKYIGLVPLTFVGDDFFLGFDTQEGIGKDIEKSIQRQLESIEKPNDQKKKINLPIIGELDISKYSLPVLAIILGFLDGFNICSLGALIFILGLVLALRSRKKIIVFGGIFILTTSLVYGLLIVMWYQLFSLLTLYVRTMQIVVGLIGIGGGIYFLRQFLKFKKQGPTCEIETGQKITSKFTSRIQETLKKSKNIFVIIGSILAFAVLVTIIEFPCSAAVPVIYAGILSQAQLPSVQYILYIVLFVLLYMVDEIIVFLIAVFTMRLWLASKKFVTYITLVEAVILFLLGIYYLSGF